MSEILQYRTVSSCQFRVKKQIKVVDLKKVKKIVIFCHKCFLFVCFFFKIETLLVGCFNYALI